MNRCAKSQLRDVEINSCHVSSWWRRNSTRLKMSEPVTIMNKALYKKLLPGSTCTFLWIAKSYPKHRKNVFRKAWLNPNSMTIKYNILNTFQQTTLKSENTTKRVSKSSKPICPVYQLAPVSPKHISSVFLSFRLLKTIIFVHKSNTCGPCQANLVLIAYASSEGPGEPAHPRSLARTFAARSYKQWVKRNLQTESQIPGPSEWLGMRS